jgi:hypothetical protein
LRFSSLPDCRLQGDICVKKIGAVFTIMGTGRERSFEGTPIRLGLDGDTLLPGPPIGENILRQ